MNFLTRSAMEKRTGRKRMRKFIVVLALSVLSLPVLGQDLDFLPDRPQGMVNDYAGMLSNNEMRLLETKLRNYRDTTTNVISVAILESLRGNSVEEVATELFNKWRMWEGERYNGVLILISQSDRQIWIEVGYGLEGAIPDVMANRVYENIIVPNFRNGNVYQGLDRATDALIQLAAGEYEGIRELNRSNGNGDFPADVIIIIVIILIFIITRGGGGRGRRRRTLGPIDVLLWSNFLGGGGRSSGGSSWGGGGSFGGGGGFGGFSGGGGFGSGGGGAGGGW